MGELTSTTSKHFRHLRPWPPPGPGRLAVPHAAAPEARAVRGAAGLAAAAHDPGLTAGGRVPRMTFGMGNNRKIQEDLGMREKGRESDRSFGGTSRFSMS